MSRGTRWDDAKVGALVLAAVAVLAAGSLWLAAGPLDGSARTDYAVVLSDSGGLQRGAPVRIAGVLVGKVSSVRLAAEEEWPVRLGISVRGSVDLHADAQARVSSSGVFGDPYLSIDPGSPRSGPLAPGETIRGRDPTGLDESLARLDEIGEKAAVLLDRTTDLITRLDERMTPLLGQVEELLAESNVAALETVLAEMRAVAEEAGPRVAPLLRRLESLTETAERSLEPIPEAVADLRRLLDGLRAAAGEDGERLERLLEAAESGLAATGDSMAVIADNRRTIEAALGDLRTTLANLEEFSRTIKERPFSMIRMKPEPDRIPGGKR